MGDEEGFLDVGVNEGSLVGTTVGVREGRVDKVEGLRLGINDCEGLGDGWVNFVGNIVSFREGLVVTNDVDGIRVRGVVGLVEEREVVGTGVLAREVGGVGLIEGCLVFDLVGEVVKAGLIEGILVGFDLTGTNERGKREGFLLGRADFTSVAGEVGFTVGFLL